MIEMEKHEHKFSTWLEASLPKKTNLLDSRAKDGWELGN